MLQDRWTPFTVDPRSTYSRIGGLPPELVDPICKSFPDGSLAKGPDGRSAGPVTSLGRARAWG